VVTFRRLNAGEAGANGAAANGAAAGGGMAAWAAGVFNLAQGIPPVRDWLQRLLGRDAADVVLSGLGIVALAVADVPLGLVMAGAEALVRRVAAIEALGRVDVVCTDKTGTLTEGRLVLRLVADQEWAAPRLLARPK
jgi:magnesium-transporting ATPase (P-type)